MPRAGWDDQLATGIPEIDSQHRGLFQLLEELRARSGVEPDESGLLTVRQLLSYADLHFSTEERVMRESGYPDLSRHETAHRALQESTTESLTRILDHHLREAEVGALLEAWLVDHIREEDLPLARWLKSLPNPRT